MSGLPEGPHMDWRAFLRTAEVDVFQTIENAILIAAKDFPDKFLEKKDHLMQTVVTNAQSLESLLKSIIEPGKKASEDNTKSVDHGGKRNIKDGKIVENSNEDGTKDEKKASDQDNSKRDEMGRLEKEDDEEDFADDMNFKTFVKRRKTDIVTTAVADATCSSLNNAVTADQEVLAGTLVAKEVKLEGEDLTMESEVTKSVLRIKNALLTMKHQPAVINGLLLKLDTMESDISFEVLQATGIASVVSSFKARDNSREIQLLADMLIETWENVFDEWIAKDSNALSNSMEVKVQNVNEITLANINEVMIAEAKVIEPNSLIKEGFSSVTRTGFSPSSQGPSNPPRAQPLHRSGSRDPATGIDDATVATSRHKLKKSRKARPSQTKRGVSLKYSEGPSKNQSSEPLVSIRSRGPANERCIVDAQQIRMCPPIHGEPTDTSIARSGDSSRGHNNTSLTSQPRHQLQGPRLSTETKPDAENKNMKMPARAEKTEEDSVKETLQIAKRKLQERLQKSQSQQAKRTTNMGPESAEKDTCTSIGELLSQYRRGHNY